MEHLEQYAFGWKEISQWFSYLQSILFVMSTCAVAVVVGIFSPSHVAMQITKVCTARH